MDPFDSTLRKHGLKAPAHIEVRCTRTVKGRGVFALEPFQAGDVVEVCPMLWLHLHGQVELPREVELYTFNWTELTGGRHAGQALAFGYGGLYNGANPANMRYEAEWDCPYPFLRFVAERAIEPDEELTINYSGFRGAAESETNWWFEKYGIPMV
jgi:hypothetical protein